MPSPTILCLLPEDGPEAALVRDAVAGLESPAQPPIPEPAQARAIVVGDLARLVGMGGGAVTPAALVPVVDASLRGPTAGISLPFLEDPAVVWVLERPLDALKVRAGLRHAVRWVALTEEASWARAEAARSGDALVGIERLATIAAGSAGPDRLLHDGLDLVMGVASAPEGRAYLVEEEDRARALVLRAASGSARRPYEAGERLPIESGSTVGEAALSGALRAAAADGRLSIAVPMLAPDGAGEKVVGVLDLRGAAAPLLPCRARHALALARMAACMLEGSRRAAGAWRRAEGLALAAAAALERLGAAREGHTVRVAALAEAMARVLDATGSGPFAGVRLSEGDVETLREAARLHLVADLEGLDAIPWPAELARVPELARACHGPPAPAGGRSLLARILRLCDRFDSAASEEPGGALERLAREACNGDLDADLLQLFVAGRLFERAPRARAMGGGGGAGRS